MLEVSTAAWSERAGSQGADEVGIAHRLRPVHPQGSRDPTQLRDVARVCGSQGPQDADPSFHHQVGSGHPGEQGDLRVPGLDRQRLAEAEHPVSVLEVDLLVGQREADTASSGLPRQPQLADLAEQPEDRVALPRVEVRLDALVGELRPAAHHGPLDPDRGPLPRRVDVDRPQQRRPVAVGEQGAGTLGELLGVQGDLPADAVQRLSPAVRLLVDGPARCDERSDVGDGVVDAEPAALPLDVERLVEVLRGRWVDRHERDVGAIQRGEPRRACCLERLLHHRGGKLRRDRHVGADRGDPLLQPGACSATRGDTRTTRLGTVTTPQVRRQVSPP